MLSWFTWTKQNLVTSRFCFAENGKQMYQELQRMLTCSCVALIFILNLLFSDVPVAVAVVVSLLILAVFLLLS